MPISPTYPGVYIDELPSAVRTIVGVPTSIAAFVGTAPRGRTDAPVHITSWADYEREFGGLAATSDMSYAVYQFYQNGGSEAEIVRIVPAGTGTGFPTATTITLTNTAATTTPAADASTATPVKLRAISPGAWGNQLLVRVDYKTPTPANGEAPTYNLTIRDKTTGVTEKYLTISTNPASSQNLANSLASSSLVAVITDGADKTPLDVLPPENADVTPGQDPFKQGADDGHGKTFYSQGSDGTDGTKDPVDSDYLGTTVQPNDGKQGINQLLKTDIFNMLCLPGAPGQSAQVLGGAAKLCVDRRAMLIVDPPTGWTSIELARKAVAPPDGKGLLSTDLAPNAAVYFPRIDLADPLKQNTVRSFPPCGVIAGVWARTDVARGVWKAPAGTDAGLNGVNQPTLPMTDVENGVLNPHGINCLRQRPVVGNVVWGARTLAGDDLLANQWKYVPVRRLALFIEESLFRGTQWVVFEPNAEPLWSSIRLNVGAFMNNLFRQGAFQGSTPQEAYQVVCDKTNNPQNDIDLGIVNIQVGFAPLKPAEFVVIHIQQLAGQIQV